MVLHILVWESSAAPDFFFLKRTSLKWLVRLFFVPATPQNSSVQMPASAQGGGGGLEALRERFAPAGNMFKSDDFSYHPKSFEEEDRTAPFPSPRRVHGWLPALRRHPGRGKPLHRNIFEFKSDGV